MAAKDIFHELVKLALINENWQITHDPYKIIMGRRRGYIDLGAEREIIAAEKANQKIAIEIKSFVGNSDLDDFEDALGQFLLYWKALKINDPERVLYLAVPVGFYERFFDDTFFMDVARSFDVKMLVFNEIEPEIKQWIR
jgi:hypothetical protein